MTMMVIFSAFALLVLILYQRLIPAEETVA
jgi:hypothetical protein